MARRCSAGGARGGGGGIQAARPSLARIGTGLAAAAGTAGLATYAALEEPAFGLFGITGLVVLLLALAVGSGHLVTPGILLVLAGYAATLVARDSAALDPAAPLVGAALLLVAELAYWSAELRGREERSVVVGRVVVLVAMGVAAVALGAGVLAATALPVGGGLFWNVVGVGAAVAAVALITRLAAVGRAARRS